VLVNIAAPATMAAASIDRPVIAFLLLWQPRDVAAI
jgi:hypothetical protein